jgi:ribulose bisphosphate carboxylase small subunit
MKYHFDLAEKRSSQGFEKLQKLLDQGYKLQEEYND